MDEWRDVFQATSFPTLTHLSGEWRKGAESPHILESAATSMPKLTHVTILFHHHAPPHFFDPLPRMTHLTHLDMNTVGPAFTAADLDDCRSLRSLTLTNPITGPPLAALMCCTQAQRLEHLRIASGSKLKLNWTVCLRNLVSLRTFHIRMNRGTDTLMQALRDPDAAAHLETLIIDVKAQTYATHQPQPDAVERVIVARPALTIIFDRTSSDSYTLWRFHDLCRQYSHRVSMHAYTR
jgi:hypothetical protein